MILCNCLFIAFNTYMLDLEIRTVNKINPYSLLGIFIGELFLITKFLQLGGYII